MALAFHRPEVVRRRFLEAGRRHGVDHPGDRRQARAGDLLHRQPQPRSQWHASQGRQPVDRFDRRPQRQHRQVEMGLPGGQARRLGLRRGLQRGAVRHQGRRQDRAGGRRSRQGRLVLHRQPRNRQADPQVGAVRADVEEHVHDADQEGRRDAARRQRRRGMVAAGLFAQDRRRLHPRSQPAHDLHALGRDRAARHHPARQHVQERQGRQGPAERHLHRHQRRQRQSRLAGQDAAADDGRRARHRRQPGVHRRGQRLVRRVQRQDRQEAVAL